MAQHMKIEVSSEHLSLLVEGREIFRSPFPGERICFVGGYEGRFIIATDYGCCPPGTIYCIGKDESTQRDSYELKKVYATGLPVSSLMLTTSGVLTVGHGCYSGVRLTGHDGTRFDIITEEKYRLLRHHEHTLPYGGGLVPKLKLAGDQIILQLDLIERVPDRTLLESYEREKNAGKNPFPIKALEHCTDSYKRKAAVEDVDLTGMLETVGVTIQNVLPLERIYSPREDF